MSIFKELSAIYAKRKIEKRTLELGGESRDVYFKHLTGDETEDLFADVKPDIKDNKRLRNKVLAMIVVDEEGNQAATAEQWGSLDNESLNKLQEAALEVNGLGKKAEDAAKKE